MSGWEVCRTIEWVFLVSLHSFCTCPNVTLDFTQHPRLTPELLATIKQPILMIQVRFPLRWALFTATDDARYNRESETWRSRSRTLRISQNASVRPKRCSSSALPVSLVLSPSKVVLKEARLSAGFLFSDGPHLVALSHSSLVISLMTQFFSRRPSFASTPVPLRPSEALATLSRIGSDPKLASRDPRNPLSYSLVSSQELRDGQERLQEMLRGEKECLLVLPMCHEMNDWDEPTTSSQRERKLRRWR